MDKKVRREEGAIIVVAVFVVLALVMVGSLSSMLTNIELDISRNDKMGKEAFFVADAGNPIATTILREMILNEGIIDEVAYETDPNENKRIYIMDKDDNADSSEFLNEVRNYYDPDEYPELNDKNNDGPEANWPEGKSDITATVSGRALDIDVDWRHRKSGAGGSILFAMGYEGIGADRSHGGVKIYYDIYSKGNATRRTDAEIKAVYLSQ